MTEPIIPVTGATEKTRAKDVYDRLRPLIVWLDLTELTWIGYWLLSGGNHSATFVGIVAGWIVTMLAWLALVIYAGTRGFFLRQLPSEAGYIDCVSISDGPRAEFHCPVVHDCAPFRAGQAARRLATARSMR